MFLPDSPEMLADHAKKLWSTPFMREAWVKAVLYLRKNSTIGLALDKVAERETKRSLLHGYVAEPIRVIVAPPETDVLPGITPISRGKRR